MGGIYMLDYGAGNVQSIVNALGHLGHSFQWISSAEDFERAEIVVFPGVGSFGAAMDKLHSLGLFEALKEYIQSDRPFMGICVGMQCLFQGSDESDAPGLGIIKHKITRFTAGKPVPHIGWNGASCVREFALVGDARYYFVHSYAAMLDHGSWEPLKEWAHSLTTYGNETFVSSVLRGNVFATQFHPEKSGVAGLQVIDSFLKSKLLPSVPRQIDSLERTQLVPLPDRLSKRVIACLDVRSNDQGDLVVTKGDQYDVREKQDGNVRNLGKPVELAKRYYEEGADEITFLNITSFRDSPLKDIPMLEVLRQTSKTVFVPLTIGGGIRDLREPGGNMIPALQVAGEYFRSGADKVSIGSDAVYACEDYLKGIRKPSSISEISRVYGRQAVVISVDPKRVYVRTEKDANGHFCLRTSRPGPDGEQYCWYQCTVKGGREARDVDVVQLVQSCEAMGAGEVLLNCMDHDGTNQGYDLELVEHVKKNTGLPVIASSGAGSSEHFADLFKRTNADAALAAGIFHRNQVTIGQVKKHLHSAGYQVRD